MSYEDPHVLLARLRLGREEFCQRLLTSLILGGPYPRWNSRSVPSREGIAFLKRLDALSFGEARWAENAVFIDELDLPRRHDDESGGAPDQAVLWPHRLWLIELKTEAGSHRRDQLPSYYRLAGRHYPGVPVDITYLTPPMTKPAPTVLPPNRYAHVTWAQVADLVAATWIHPAGSEEQAVRDALLDTIANLALAPGIWREQMTLVAAGHSRRSFSAPASIPVQVPAASNGLVRRSAELASQTAADGAQRALDAELDSLEALQSLRLEVRNVLADEPAESHLRRVRPWLWSETTSGGQALTSAGRATGYELRFSLYKQAVP